LIGVLSSTNLHLLVSTRQTHLTLGSAPLTVPSLLTYSSDPQDLDFLWNISEPGGEHLDNGFVYLAGEDVIGVVCETLVPGKTYSLLYL